MSIKNGGPAFPLQSIGPEFSPGHAGMTLRDYFAASALQGLLSNPKLADDIRKQGGPFGGWTEALAFGWADAMLKERERVG